MIVTVTTMLAIPVVASAQQTSGIAGVVRDASGAVLPGVQVETTSPALIEKVRTAITDEAGRFNIVELRPGAYTVTFTLSGFRTVRREGIELSGGFTATTNAQMEVGGLEESVTVTGASPLVDVQNTRNQTRVDEKLLAALPSGNKGVTALLTLTPGVTGAADVGGSLGVYRSMGAPQFITFHGRTGMKVYYDGMDVLNISGNGYTGFIINSQNVAEMALESSGVSAESASSGFSSNAIPKEGSNRFESSASFLYTTGALNSTNLTDELRARGLTTTEKVLNQRDIGGVFGGPIRKDRAWFLASVRQADNRNQKPGIFFNLTPGTPIYTPDASRAGFRHETFWTGSGRVTLQASPRNKFSGFYEAQHLCGCPRDGLYSPEADTGLDFYPQWLAQGTWSSPVTSRLLLQAGYSFARDDYYSWGPETTPAEAISIFEISNGFTYNNRPSWATINPSDRGVQRFTASYVTGTHSFKTGVLAEQMALGTTDVMDRKVGFLGEQYGNVSYRFLGGVPNGVTQYATPYSLLNKMKTFGVFAQDQWVLNRLTLNFGLRFDYFNGYVPAQSAGAGTYVPARQFAEVKDVPNWTDLSPRVGGVYDLFGNGRTAIKAYIGRYVTQEASTITNANNPFTTTVSSVNRTWNDSFYPVGDPRRGNYVPDCDLADSRLNGECGAFGNQNFGGINPSATRYDPAILSGFGVRPASWDYTVELQQQVGSGVSISGGYFHTKLVNFRVTDNTLVTPADYSSYCATAPVDRELPGGGGYQVCGLADVAPALFGRVVNLVTDASNFGTQKQSSDFFALNFRARLAGANQLGGGIDTGRSVRERCFVVDSPQELLYCRVVTGFGAQTQVKLFGTYMAPAEIQLSGTFQAFPGANYVANYNATNSQIAPSLGRSLAACGAQAACNSTAVVPLLAPDSAYEHRRTQLDLRVSRTFPLGGRVRLQANFDVYNLLNDGSLLSPNGLYGPQWRLPAPPGSVTPSGSGLLVGRLGQVSGQLTF
jgi:hypothetical protein